MRKCNVLISVLTVAFSGLTTLVNSANADVIDVGTSGITTHFFPSNAGAFSFTNSIAYTVKDLTSSTQISSDQAPFHHTLTESIIANGTFDSSTGMWDITNATLNLAETTLGTIIASGPVTGSYDTNSYNIDFTFGSFTVNGNAGIGSLNVNGPVVLFSQQAIFTPDVVFQSSAAPLPETASGALLLLGGFGAVYLVRRQASATV